MPDFIEPENLLKTKTLICKTQNANLKKSQPKALLQVLANGLRYLRWGGDGEAVQPEKSSGVENCLEFRQNPQRQVHALLGAFHCAYGSKGSPVFAFR